MSQNKRKKTLEIDVHEYEQIKNELHARHSSLLCLLNIHEFKLHI